MESLSPIAPRLPELHSLGENNTVQTEPMKRYAPRPHELMARQSRAHENLDDKVQRSSGQSLNEELVTLLGRQLQVQMASQATSIQSQIIRTQHDTLIAPLRVIRTS